MNKQSVRRVLDKQQILQVFADYLASKYGKTAETYLSDHEMLDNLVKNDKSFPWQDIAAQVNLDRWRLYHWYFETFQRMLAGSIDKEDVQRMREMIKKAMSSEEPLDKQFQQHVKQALSKEYHRSSFSIAFNNTKRQVMKELGKTELPTARPTIRLDSSKEVQQLLERQQTKLIKEQEQTKNQHKLYRQQLEMQASAANKAAQELQQQQEKKLVLEQKQPEADTIAQQDEKVAQESKIMEEDPDREASAWPDEDQIIQSDLFMSMLTSEESDFCDVTFDDCGSSFQSVYNRTVIPSNAYQFEESCMSYCTDEMPGERFAEGRSLSIACMFLPQECK